MKKLSNTEAQLKKALLIKKRVINIRCFFEPVQQYSFIVILFEIPMTLAKEVGNITEQDDFFVFNARYFLLHFFEGVHSNVNVLPRCSGGTPFLNESSESKIMMMVCRHLDMNSGGDIDFLFHEVYYSFADLCFV